MAVIPGATNSNAARRLGRPKTIVQHFRDTRIHVLRRRTGKSLSAMKREIAAEPVWPDVQIDKRAGALATVANRLRKDS